MTDEDEVMVRIEFTPTPENRRELERYARLFGVSEEKLVVFVIEKFFREMDFAPPFPT